ncbi:hypothetical protein GCM10010123_40960 [Pilimelia anulata]|uniref:Fatty acid hydroxylase domain-containing protein n=1 Tax=Pilimelia anulata TaxID=53371 RepID=A0A8J3FCN1_9ACTN|nr:sterol desaturase family protein [Pilimelia anulata]GGK06993.1 hypothetical protein GCM10010123_40960 [Pilimelia anulata]
MTAPPVSPPLPRALRLDDLTRGGPGSVVVAYVPLILTASAAGLLNRPWYATAGLLAAGYLLWTLTEYWVHRLLFHFTPRTPRAAALHRFLHGRHHEDPRDPDRLVVPPLVGLPIVALLWLPAALTLPLAAWAPVGAGWLAGYVGYDLLHDHLHRRRPRTALGRWLRRHHLRHHYADDGTAFGVSAPYWDVVFGTRPPAHPRPPAR